MQIVLQKRSLPVPLEPEPCTSSRGEPRVGDLPEVLALPDVGQMDLDRRDGDRLQSVQDRDARVRIGGRVDDDAVIHAVGRLDLVDERPLVVRLKDPAPEARLPAGLFAEGL